jgi:hypothetical protein
MTVIYENVQLHNVAEVRPSNGGVRLQRLPEEVRQQINPNARKAALRAANCEIRFTMEGDEAKVTLSSEGETQLRVFQGPFDARTPRMIGPDPTTITVSRSPFVAQLDRRWWEDQPFDPNVFRLVFGVRDPLILHDIQGNGIRPPGPEQLPTITCLTYGTSITQGAKSEAPHLSYAAQTAWHLGADLINLGLGGSCHCEPVLADYIAGRDDWQIASLALSVNMMGFALDEFSRRVEHMVRTVGGADPQRPVACITLYPFRRDFLEPDPNLDHGGTPEQFRQALRDAVAACDLPNLHLIEGPDLLTNIGGLSNDLLHPSDNAMIEIGRNLAARLKPL